MSNSIFLIQGFHHSVPGVQQQARATRALADVAAATMINTLLDDVQLPADATADNWQEKLIDYRNKRAEDIGIDTDTLTDDDAGTVTLEEIDIPGFSNNPQLICDLWGKIEEDSGDFFDLRERVRGAIWHGETEISIAAGIKPLVFEKANAAGGLEFLRAESANGYYAIFRVDDAFELRLSGISIGGQNFADEAAAMKAAGDHYREHMKKFAAIITTRVVPMKLSDGSTDYFVEVACEGRSMTPHKHKIEGRALYEAAQWDWLFKGVPKPDILAFDTENVLNDNLAATIETDISTLDLMRPDAVTAEEPDESPNYRAVVTVTTSYHVDVAAGNEASARDVAEHVYTQSSDPCEDFPILWTDVEVESVSAI